jgi:hypothetical protein
MTDSKLAKLALVMFLLVALNLIGASANAFDYKKCIDAKTDLSVSNGGMREVLAQVMQLEKVGQGEDINFETLAYLSTTVDAYFIGFMTAKTILIPARFSSKEDEETVRESFKNLSINYIRSLQYFTEKINQGVAFVRNQSVRDDLKAIVKKNNLLLQKLSNCSG